MDRSVCLFVCAPCCCIIAAVCAIVLQAAAAQVVQETTATTASPLEQLQAQFQSMLQQVTHRQVFVRQVLAGPHCW